MKELLKQSILTCLTLSLVSCGGLDSPSTEQSNVPAIFSLGLSDAKIFICLLCLVHHKFSVFYWL